MRVEIFCGFFLEALRIAESRAACFRGGASARERLFLIVSNTAESNPYVPRIAKSRGDLFPRVLIGNLVLPVFDVLDDLGLGVVDHPPASDGVFSDRSLG